MIRQKVQSLGKYESERVCLTSFLRWYVCFPKQASHQQLVVLALAAGDIVEWQKVIENLDLKNQ